MSWLGWGILQLIGKTSRITFHVPDSVRKLEEENKPFIYAFWHRYQLLLAYSHRARGINVLVSQSKDGELIASTIERMGFSAIRGSSSKGGAAALIGMINVLRRGGVVAFTPDGPRGPFRSVQPGVLAAARKSGCPIVPLAWAGGKTKELSSWDRFLIPYPFGRYHVVWGEPVYVERASDAEDETRRALDQARSKAESFLL